MVTENKYFIFDSPKTVARYIVDIIRYIPVNIYYKLQFACRHPRNVERKKYYSSVCAIFKNEANYLQEWIEYHKVIGIDHFYLYNNFSADAYQEVLKKYVYNGEVTLIEWPIKQGQMSAYADCARRFANETNWIAYIDLDEFIVPNEDVNLNDILVKFEKKRPVVIAYWRLFGTSGLLSRDTKGLLIEDFYLCWRKYTNIGKCFFNTAYDYAEDLKENVHMHYRWARWEKQKLPAVNFYDKIICCGVNRAKSKQPPVQINHYFTKSYEEYLAKVSRGDAFFELNPRDEEYFYEHELKCQATDYNIRKYMIKLKKIMNEVRREA